MFQQKTDSASKSNNSDRVQLHLYLFVCFFAKALLRTAFTIYLPLIVLSTVSTVSKFDGRLKLFNPLDPIAFTMTSYFVVGSRLLIFTSVSVDWKKDTLKIRTIPRLKFKRHKKTHNNSLFSVSKLWWQWLVTISKVPWVGFGLVSLWGSDLRFRLRASSC